MTLNKIRLGDYILRSTINNHDLKYGTDLIVGVTSQGVFDTPKVDPLGVDLKPYKIVNNGAFVYNPTRLNLGSIAYRTDGLCIVSHLYMVFYLNDKGKQIIDPQFLYMYFRRDEFRREVTFRNFGSQRPEFNFSDMCDIEIPLPSISVQRKYVNVYASMKANANSYVEGLEDLKLTFDAFIDKYKNDSPTIKMGSIFEEVDARNNNGSITEVHGININKQFMISAADTLGVDLKKYKIVSPGQIAFSGMQTGRDESIRIAMNCDEKPIIISPAYTVFKIINPSVLPEYIMMWFSRKEVDRLGWFMSDSSIRSNLDLNRFYEIEIPVPSIDIQKSIVDLYLVYKKRIALREQLQKQIKDICPILINGAIREID